MLGPQDIAVIGVLALIFFGPEQLPKVARKAGQVVRDVQNTSQSFIREMEKAADDLDMRDAFKSSETHPGPLVDIPKPAPDPYASVLPSENSLHEAQSPESHEPAHAMTGPQPPYGKLAEPTPAIADQMRERPDPDAVVEPIEPIEPLPKTEPPKAVRNLPTEVAYEDASGI